MRSMLERSGCSTGIQEFNRFIDASGLVYIPLNGKRFTWFGQGNKMTRLDRFLLSMEWINAFRDLCQKGLRRSISDHVPLLLQNVSVNWRPKQFKFLNCWFQKEGFLEEIAKEWSEIEVSGREGFKVVKTMSKLKFLKDWNNHVFGNVEEGIKALENRIDQLENAASKRDLIDDEVVGRKKAIQDLWETKLRNESL
ncbi:uncharacterized protein LOC111288954 [Durio zibethinus]|uniref:Uncharacterized protein LOC111288954 n=1 Tax=Durio zibethinus TaxID=66656 RepID=A0A6P5Y594_DURZI|nr:uncharacterized protein LOC111288954 [Durio zibethinus]